VSTALETAIHAVLDAQRTPDAPIPVAEVDRLHTLLFRRLARDFDDLVALDDAICAAFVIGARGDWATSTGNAAAIALRLHGAKGA
jgi:hypothetical protein